MKIDINACKTFDDELKDINFYKQKINKLISLTFFIWLN